MITKIFDAKELRTTKIKYKDQGCYKWWAKEADLEQLVNGLNKVSKIVDINEVKEQSERDPETGFYCIYVGLSNNLKRRLNTHVNGTIRRSTLRKTLGSILQCYKHDNVESEIDNFIDSLKLQYIEMPNENIDQKETELIIEYFHLLNNDKNDHKLADRYGLKGLITDARAIAAKENPSLFKKNINK